MKEVIKTIKDLLEGSKTIALFFSVCVFIIELVKLVISFVVWEWTFGAGDARVLFLAIICLVWGHSRWIINN